MAQDYYFPHFAVTFPSPFVAQVAIARPEKLNAFTERMFFTLVPYSESSAPTQMSAPSCSLHKAIAHFLRDSTFRTPVKMVRRRKDREARIPDDGQSIS